MAGFLFIVISAVSFGFMALFASWTRAEGVTTEMLLFLRFGIAGAALALWMLMRGMRFPRGRDLPLLAFMGGVLYAGMSMCYFHGLRHIPAGLVALLLYLYPVIVTILSRVILKEHLTRTRLVAIASAVLGLTLTVGPIALQQPHASDSQPETIGQLVADQARPATDGNVPLGVVLGLGSALLLSIYVIIGGPVAQRVGAIPSSTMVMLSCGAVFGVMALVRGDAFPSSGQAWTGALCLAIFSTLIAVTAFLAGLRRIGAVQASTLSTLEPVTTVIVSAAFLHEDFTPVQMLGGALILTAAIIVARTQQTKVQ